MWIEHTLRQPPPLGNLADMNWDGNSLTAGQPETRTYRLQLYDGDNPVGDTSDEVSVVSLP